MKRKIIKTITSICLTTTICSSFCFTNTSCSSKKQSIDHITSIEQLRDLDASRVFTNIGLNYKDYTEGGKYTDQRDPMYLANIRKDLSENLDGAKNLFECIMLFNSITKMFIEMLHQTTQQYYLYTYTDFTNYATTEYIPFFEWTIVDFNNLKINAEQNEFSVNALTELKAKIYNTRTDAFEDYTIIQKWGSYTDIPDGKTSLFGIDSISYEVDIETQQPYLYVDLFSNGTTGYYIKEEETINSGTPIENEKDDESFYSIKASNWFKMFSKIKLVNYNSTY